MRAIVIVLSVVLCSCSALFFDDFHVGERDSGSRDAGTDAGSDSDAGTDAGLPNPLAWATEITATQGVNLSTLAVTNVTPYDVWVGGYFRGEVTLDGTTHTAVGATDALLVRLLANGQVADSAAFGGPGGGTLPNRADAVRRIALDRTNAAYIGVHFEGDDGQLTFPPVMLTGDLTPTVPDSPDVGVLGMNADLTPRWGASTFVPNTETQRGLVAVVGGVLEVVDAYGASPLTVIDGTGTMSSFPMPHPGTADFYVVSFFGSDGQIEWAQTLGSSGDDSGGKIGVGFLASGDGVLFVAACFGALVDLTLADTSVVTLPPGLAVLRLNGSTGLLERAVGYSEAPDAALFGCGGSDSIEAMHVVQTADGPEIWIAGSFSGSLSLPTSGAPIRLTSAGDTDALVVKFDADGLALDAAQYGDTAEEWFMAYRPAPDGFFGVGIAFDPGAGPQYSFGFGTFSVPNGINVVAHYGPGREPLWMVPIEGPLYLWDGATDPNGGFVVLGNFTDTSFRIGPNDFTFGPITSSLVMRFTP